MTDTIIIESRDGIILGDFQADSPRDALDLLAQEAGYADYDAQCEVLGSDPENWVQDFIFQRASGDGADSVVRFRHD